MTSQARQIYRGRISSLRARGRELLRREARWRLTLQVGLVFGGALLTGLCQVALNSTGLPDEYRGALQALWAVGLALVMAGGAILAFVDQSAPEALREADEALTAARDLAEAAAAEQQAELQRLQTLQQEAVAGLDRAENTLVEALAEHELLQDAYQRLGTLYVLSQSTVGEGLERIALTDRPDEDQLRQLTTLILDNFALFPRMLFEFDDEYWSLTVLRPRLQADGVVRLTSFATRRSSTRSEQGAHRSWELGEGCAGRAWQSGEEFVVTDMRDEHWARSLHIRPENRRDADDERHRSIAAIPILVGEKVLGVLSASSSTCGRFVPRRDRTLSLDSVETLRAIVSNLAILLALTHSDDSQIGPVSHGKA